MDMECVVSPWFGGFVLLITVVAVAGTIRGLRREIGSKAGWTVTLVFAAICLLFAVHLPIVLPKFAGLFRDLWIR